MVNVTRHCKQDALDDREFELFLEGARSLPEPRSFDARLIALLAGRLGLRAGEIAHMRESWINERKNRIEIPRYQECTKGKNGGLCGYCIQQCQQMANADTPTTYEEAKETMWSPKTRNAVRAIPFESSTRAEIMIKRYFERYDEYQASRTSINRRVTNAAKAAPELSHEDIYPHCLRATCASFLAARGLDVYALQGMMGWERLKTAEVYIQKSGEHTARKLRQVPG